MNDAGFQYEVALPSGTADCVVVLLHGSGRDDNDLLAFGRAVFPNAVLYALRGAARRPGKMVMHFSAESPTGKSTWMI